VASRVNRCSTYSSADIEVAASKAKRTLPAVNPV